MSRNISHSDLFTFRKDFWADTESEITFVPASQIPNQIPVTAVKCIAIRINKILLTKIPRGWDIPTGHVENGETVEEALSREVYEETGAKLVSAKLIGYMRLYQLRKNVVNKKYPRLSAIAVFTSNDFKMSQQIPSGFEAEGRMLVPLKKIAETHHNWTDMMQDITAYACDVLREKY